MRTLAILVMSSTWALAAELDPAAIERGAPLYLENCASCHGENLEGQPNWRTQNDDGTLPAPPHDDSGHTWHHSDKILFDYTKLGGAATMAKRGLDFESGMPGHQDTLSDDQIWDILTFIKSKWSQDSLNVQRQRSELDPITEN